MSVSSRGAVEGYMMTNDLLGELAPAAQVLIDHAEGEIEFQDHLRRLVASGRQLQGSYLAHVHGVASPGTTPDLVHLARDLEVAKANTEKMVNDAARQLWFDGYFSWCEHFGNLLGANKAKLLASYQDARGANAAEESTWLALRTVFGDDYLHAFEEYLQHDLASYPDGDSLFGAILDSCERNYIDRSRR